MKRIISILLIILSFCASSIHAKGKELAIISASRFDSHVYQYKMWKSLEGFDVTIKKADSLGGLDTTLVWDWIHSTWWPGNDNYVFILGKQSEIPANYIADMVYGNSFFFSDWHYASHDHSNLITSGWPNLLVGRLTADSADAGKVLQKFISYEFAPASYNPKRVLTEAAYYDDTDWPTGSRTNRLALIDFTWGSSNVDTLIFSNSPFSSWVADSYRDSLEKRWQKYSIIYHNGHGNGNGFTDLNSSDFYYYPSYHLPLANLNLNKGYEVFITEACYNAGFVAGSYSSHSNIWSPLDRLICQTSTSRRGPIFAIGAIGNIGFRVDQKEGDAWYCRPSSALTDSSFNTWGQIGRVFSYRGEDSFWPANIQFIGDPTVSFRTADPSTAEVAPSSYISVTSPAVVAFTGSDVGSVRVSAYAPNSGWFSTTTLTGDTYTTFSTSDRPLFIAFTKDDASKTPTVWTTGGTLNVNTWMLGRIHVNGDLTVGSGKTMEVLPGTKMYFKTDSDDRSGGTNSSKAELIINGTLKADSATFTRHDNSSYWSGIKFGTSATSSHILGCTVSYGVTGVYVNEADPTISDNQILNNDDHGIYITGSGAWPMITNNYIGAADYAVYIYATSSGGHFGHDAFRSATYGLFLANGSPVIEGENYGYNFWDSSISNKRVYVYNGYLELGMDEDPGNNSFTKGSDNTKDYIYNASGITVYARNCYFYDCPSPDTDWFYGPVDRSNKLPYPPTDPSAGPDFDIPKGTITSTRQYAEIKRSLASGAAFSQAKALNTLVVNNINSEFAARPLDLLLGNLSRAEGQKVIDNFSKYNKMHDAVRFALDQWQLRYDSQDGIPDAACLSRYQGTVFEKAMAMTYAAGLAANGQKERAVEVLKEANRDTDPMVVESLIAGLDHSDSIPSGKTAAATAEKQSVEISAYPNPFNSESRIQFKLTQKGLVKVTVYNLLGQKVVELVNGEKGAGSHLATWDGKNQAGNQVPTGVYFCQINAGGVRQTLKLFMLR